MPTWSQRFEYLSSLNEDAYVRHQAGDGTTDLLYHSSEAIARLLERYRAEGYPGMEAPLPRDLLN